MDIDVGIEQLKVLFLIPKNGSTFALISIKIIRPEMEIESIVCEKSKNCRKIS